MIYSEKEHVVVMIEKEWMDAIVIAGYEYDGVTFYFVETLDGIKRMVRYSVYPHETEIDGLPEKGKPSDDIEQYLPRI